MGRGNNNHEAIHFRREAEIVEDEIYNLTMDRIHERNGEIRQHLEDQIDAHERVLEHIEARQHQK